MYEKILVPFDGSPTSEQALKEAAGLALKMGAQVRLLHIIEKNASVFKYEMTKKHLSEDQIELIYPLIVNFIEKVYKELQTAPKKKV